MYLRVVCDYVHLNPARAGLIGEEKSLADYAWSSFPEYLKPTKRRFGWLRVDRLFGELGIRRDNSKGRREFGEIMAARCREEGHAEEELWKGIRRGWKFGAEDFVERLVGMGHGGAGNAAIHLSEALEETMEEKARGIVREFLKTRGMELDEFRRLRKGHPDKIALAAELRKSTTMTMALRVRVSPAYYRFFIESLPRAMHPSYLFYPVRGAVDGSPCEPHSDRDGNMEPPPTAVKNSHRRAVAAMG
jgi:hypothetical protein